MCRNIKRLSNYDSPATDDEVRASALQFVRKISGSSKPSKANQEAFNLAVDQVAQAARQLLDSLVTVVPAKNRSIDLAKVDFKAETK